MPSKPISKHSDIILATYAFLVVAGLFCKGAYSLHAEELGQPSSSNQTTSTITIQTL